MGFTFSQTSLYFESEEHCSGDKNEDAADAGSEHDFGVK